MEKRRKFLLFGKNADIILVNTVDKKTKAFLKKYGKSLEEYIIFYNERRPHSYLRNRTPNKAESDYYHYSSQKEKVSIEQWVVL